MAKKKNNIVIKRIRKQINPNSKDNVNPKKSNKEIFETQYKRQLKLLSLLLILISFLTILALISYSSKDEANTQVTFSELISILKGQDDIIAKAQTTSNWLGLVGAIISDYLYNSTIGITIIFFPFLVIYWSKYLFLTQKASRKLIRTTVVSISLSFLLSSFFGILHTLSWMPNIPKEFPGNFGFFSSNVLSSIFGSIGALIILIAAIFGLIFLGFKINYRKYYDLVISLIDISKTMLKNISSSSKESDTQSKVESEPIEQGNDNAKEEAQEEEPARIVKRNLEIEESSDIDPLKDPLKAYSQTIKTNTGDTNQRNSDFSEKNDIEIRTYRGSKSDDVQNYEVSDKEKQFDKDIDELNLNNDDSHQIQSNQTDEQETVSEDNNEEDDDTKLVVTVTEHVVEEEHFVPVNLLSTTIHDEDISYKPPRIDLLIDDEDKYEINEEELKLNARILQEKLETFKIYIENLSVTPGPVVTQYEFIPAAGIKISKIEALADDIAMALKARGIRIIAPIPGKGTVGIEIPNQNPLLVRFSSCIKSSKFHNSDFKLPIALGKTISGEVFVTDLSKMPHLLIAGATGTGKSVGINTIISSLLYKMHPSTLKFVIIDPKKVELTQYAKLQYHFLASSPEIDNKIITDPQDAVIILNALCAEMDLRYDILSQAGQRNIYDYNKKIRDGKLKSDDELVHKEMPYIITIIDELADLMLTAAKEVETPIIRLAQLARAVGIHLVLATQRPSVDVITGIIKANFPARISYLVASKIDSRTILDVMGAEKLLGNGDLLFQYGGSVSPIRMQNAFLSTDEVDEICNYIGKQKGYSQPYILPSLTDNNNGKQGVAKEDRDVLFDEAARLVVRLQQASVSLIQRRLKVGYARAGRIIDELESNGIVGPFDGSKARTVLVDSEDELQYFI